MTADLQSKLRAGHPIDGVDLWPLTMHADARGSFMEVFQQAWGSAIEPVQWSLVRSAARVLRGMHLHLYHDEYIMVLEGHASVGLRDVRPGSPTEGAFAMYDLHGTGPAALTFPSGIIHGWYSHTPTIHLQAVSESYIDYHPHDNLGCHWADPALELPWTDPTPIVTERANGFPKLDALLSRVTASWPSPVL